MKTDKLSIEFLNPENCVFSFNDNGFLLMTLDSENMGRVKLIRTYPYTLKDEYICVHNLDDKEIGIIRDLNALDQNSCENAKKELENRYYCPTVTSIKSVKERIRNPRASALCLKLYNFRFFYNFPNDFCLFCGN